MINVFPTSLYGGILHQAYRYYRTYATDRLGLKTLVSFSWPLISWCLFDEVYAGIGRCVGQHSQLISDVSHDGRM